MYKQVKIELSYKKNQLEHTTSGHALLWEEKDIAYSTKEVDSILNKVYKKYIAMTKQEEIYNATDVGFNFTIENNSKCIYRIGLYRYYCFLKEYKQEEQTEITPVVETITNDIGDKTHKVHKILRKHQLYTMINDVMKLFINDCSTK